MVLNQETKLMEGQLQLFAMVDTHLESQRWKNI